MRTAHLTIPLTFLVGVLLIAIYWPGLHGGFFFDDGPSILQADQVQLNNLSLESLRQALGSGSAGPSGRPIAQLSFALNYYFSGFDPFAFKATNLAIHLVNGVLIFFLAFRVLRSTGLHHKAIIFFAGGVALTWLLHPIQLLCVLHVVQRMTSLSALFLLGALLLHIQARETNTRASTYVLLLAWGLFWPLSVLTKETGALFPVFVLAWELCIRRASSGRLDRFARWLMGSVGLALVAAVIYSTLPAAQWLWAGYELRPFSLGERLLTEARVLWFYLGLIFLPRFESFGLYHDDIIVSTGLVSPISTLPAIVGLVCLCWAAWHTRNRAPLISFGIAWFLIGHAMESTALPLEIAHEHRNYLPSFGVLLAVAGTLRGVIEHQGLLKTTAVAISLAAMVYFPLVTALRSHEFSDDGRRTQIEAQHHRNSSRAQFDAGSYLASLSDSLSSTSPTYLFARRHYELAAQLDRNSKVGLLGLLDLDCKSGNRANDTTLKELAHRLRETPFAPGDRNVLYSIKEMTIARQLCLSRAEVTNLFSSAISNPSTSPNVRAMLYSWYADYLVLRQKDIPAAKEALATSLRLVPGNVSNQLKWAQLVLLEGNERDAIQLLKALQKAPLSSTERTTTQELLECLERTPNQCARM